MRTQFRPTNITHPAAPVIAQIDGERHCFTGLSKQEWATITILAGLCANPNNHYVGDEVLKARATVLATDTLKGLEHP